MNRSDQDYHCGPNGICWLILARCIGSAEQPSSLTGMSSWMPTVHKLNCLKGSRYPNFRFKHMCSFETFVFACCSKYVLLSVAKRCDLFFSFERTEHFGERTLWRTRNMVNENIGERTNWRTRNPESMSEGFSFSTPSPGCGSSLTSCRTIEKSKENLRFFNIFSLEASKTKGFSTF